MATIDEMRGELCTAGWEPIEGPEDCVWRSPSGLCYRKTIVAWTLMKTHPELNIKAIDQK